MFTATALLDLHTRTHTSFGMLLDHCAGFRAAQLHRRIDGFGAGSIAEQFQHVIGAERYWIGVLHGELLTDDDPADRASSTALRAFHDRIAATTAAYLRSTSDDDLNAARTLSMWGGRTAELVPARVVVRTLTHAFQHQGQIAAMCRLLGRPIPRGLDFPLG